MIFLFYLGLKKKKPLHPVFLYGCFPWWITAMDPFMVASATPSWQRVPGQLSSTEIFIFPLYYTYVTLTDGDEEKEIFCTFIYSTWQLSNKDNREREMGQNLSWILCKNVLKFEQIKQDVTRNPYQPVDSIISSRPHLIGIMFFFLFVFFGLKRRISPFLVCCAIFLPPCCLTICGLMGFLAFGWINCTHCGFFSPWYTAIRCFSGCQIHFVQFFSPVL